MKKKLITCMVAMLVAATSVACSVHEEFGFHWSYDSNGGEVLDTEPNVEEEDEEDLSEELDTSDYEVSVDSEGTEDYDSLDEDTYEEENEQHIELEVTFRNETLLNQHYEKHGIDMGFLSAEEYEYAAMLVVNNPEALHKTEAEDGDDVYYVEATNEFVIVSTDGYIRTYFLPDRGIDYYNRQ